MRHVTPGRDSQERAAPPPPNRAIRPLSHPAGSTPPPTLSPWTCESGGAVVSTPVHGGSHALAAAATASQTGECAQTLTLSPNTTYTLSGWVQGSYGYLGVRGDASASTWGSSSGYAKQSVAFTTGPTGAVTVYLHGWYGQGTVYGDDISVTS